MNKVVVQDTVPYVPNGGQMYYLDARDDLVAISDDEAKKLIRRGTPIRAPGAGVDNYRAVLKRLGFAYAEMEELRGNGSAIIRVRTGHVQQERMWPEAPVGVVYKYVVE